MYMSLVHGYALTVGTWSRTVYAGGTRVVYTGWVIRVGIPGAIPTQPPHAREQTHTQRSGPRKPRGLEWVGCGAGTVPFACHQGPLHPTLLPDHLQQAGGPLPAVAVRRVGLRSSTRLLANKGEIKAYFSET